MVNFGDRDEKAEGERRERVGFYQSAWQLATKEEEEEGGRSEDGWWSPCEFSWRVIWERLSDATKFKVHDWTHSSLTGTWLILDELILESFLSETKEIGASSDSSSLGWDVTIADADYLKQCVCSGWMTEEHGSLPVLTSLSSLLQVLYKSRQVAIVLLGQRVKRRSLLAIVEHPKNFSVDVQVPSKDDSSRSYQRVSITLGLSQAAKEGSGQAMTGFFVYSSKRLLIPFLQLSVQKDRVGRGVIGLIEMEHVFSFTMTKVCHSLRDPFLPPSLRTSPPPPSLSQTLSDSLCSGFW